MQQSREEEIVAHPALRTTRVAYPIFPVGMGPAAGPELVTVVSNARRGGGLGGLA